MGIFKGDKDNDLPVGKPVIKGEQEEDGPKNPTPPPVVGPPPVPLGPPRPIDDPAAAARAERERLEAAANQERREHLNKLHGFSSTPSAGISIITSLHTADHESLEPKGILYVPHHHDGDTVTIEGVPDGVPKEWEDDQSIHP